MAVKISNAAALAALKKMSTPKPTAAKKSATPSLAYPEGWEEITVRIANSTEIYYGDELGSIDDLKASDEIALIGLSGDAKRIECPPVEGESDDKKVGKIVSIENSILTFRYSKNLERLKKWKLGKQLQKRGEALAKQQAELLSPTAWELRRDLCMRDGTCHSAVEFVVGDEAVKYIAQEKYTAIDAASPYAPLSSNDEKVSNEAAIKIKIKAFLIDEHHANWISSLKEKIKEEQENCELSEEMLEDILNKRLEQTKEQCPPYVSTTKPAKESEILDIDWDVESLFSEIIQADIQIKVSQDGMAEIGELLGKMQKALATKDDPDGSLAFNKFFTVATTLRPTTAFHDGSQTNKRLSAVYDMLRKAELVKYSSPYLLQ